MAESVAMYVTLFVFLVWHTDRLRDVRKARTELDAAVPVIDSARTCIFE